MKEEWRTIEETNGKYSVSNLGNVKRNEHYTIVSPTSTHMNGAKLFYKERKLNPYLNKEGYRIVRLQLEEGNARTVSVHRLVAENFIPNPNNYPQINHIDENRTNNCISNLEWCTAVHNANHGTRKEKLRKISGIRVAQYDLQGNLIKIWDSISQASQSFGAKTTSCIRRVCKGESGRLSYRGYIWRYVDNKVIGDSNLKEQMLSNKQMLIDTVLNSFSNEELKEIMKNIELKLSKSKK